MMDLAKAIREGLVRQSKTAATNHPDPDLLTGFVEHALTETERSTVLRHLTMCGTCREVIALSLPEVEVVPVAAAAPAPSVWSRWAFARWAAAAAAVVVVGSAVTFVEWNKPQPQQRAAIVDGPAYLASKQAQPTQSAVAPQQQAPAETAAKVSVKSTASSDVLIAKASPRALDLSKRSDIASAEKPAASVAPPSVTQVAGVERLTPIAPLVERPSAPDASRAAMMTAASGNGVTSFGFNGPGRSLAPSQETPVIAFNEEPNQGVFIVQRQKSRGPNISFGSSLPKSDSFTSQRSSLFPSSTVPSMHAIRPRWIASPDGQLQHSHGGEQWHAVKVADGIFFKSVDESGSEVWAGGVGGALYHSTDNGSTWMKVVPTSGNQPLINDVESVHAGAHSSAEVRTSNGEHWTTVDGGQHWIMHRE